MVCACGASLHPLSATMAGLGVCVGGGGGGGVLQIDLAVPKGTELCGDHGRRWKQFGSSVDRQPDR